MRERAGQAVTHRFTTRKLWFRGTVALPLGHSLAALRVERDIHGIRINYEIVPPLPAHETSFLEVRVRWAAEDASLWERPALALRIRV